MALVIEVVGRFEIGVGDETGVADSGAAGVGRLDRLDGLAGVLRGHRGHAGVRITGPG